MPLPRCPNCDDGCRIAMLCDGCDEMLCEPCWAEHNLDAPCHTDGIAASLALDMEYIGWAVLSLIGMALLVVFSPIIREVLK